MAAPARITPESFLTLTTPADVVSDEYRTAVASNTARFARQKRPNLSDSERRKIIRSFSAWRAADGPSSRRPPSQEERRWLPTSPAVVPLRKPRDGPLDILGQGRKDPFANYAIPDVPGLVHEVLDHAVHHFWPGLTPGRMPNAVNPVNEGYLADVRTSPLAYYSYMVGIAENYELLSGGNAKTRMFERLCLSYRVNMVKLISQEIQEIQEMNRPPSDVLLAALIALTASASTSRDRAKFGPLELAKSSRFKSPLRTAQFIHVYSANQYPSVHTEALIRLIIMKGGLSKIGSPGVASVASLCELVICSQTNIQPIILSMCPPTLAGFQDLSQVVAEEKGLVPPITVWDDLPVNRHRRPEFLQAILAMSVVNTALDWYLQGVGPAMTFAGLVHARNDAQYLLLCLSPTIETVYNTPLSSEALGENIYEIGRISLRIYSNLVLFPMNPRGGTGGILAGALREAILQSNNASPWRLLPNTCKRMLLWALMLGGIQVDDGVVYAEEERAWFVEQLAEVSSSIGLLTWQQVEECLSSFMWLDFVLNPAAVELWVDVRMKIMEMETYVKE